MGKAAENSDDRYIDGLASDLLMVVTRHKARFNLDGPTSRCTSYKTDHISTFKLQLMLSQTYAALALQVVFTCYYFLSKNNQSFDVQIDLQSEKTKAEITCQMTALS